MILLIETNWHRLADRFAAIAIPAPPASETRIRLGMLRGPGERVDQCRSYGDCIDRAARMFDGQAHCPPSCGSRSELTRAERIHLALDGQGTTVLGMVSEGLTANQERSRERKAKRRL